VFVSNHVLAGALIGAAVRRPGRAFVVATASHLAMDAIPHWGEDGDAERWLRAARRDGVAALVLLGGIAALTPAARRRAVLAGAAGAVGPDLRAPAEHFFGSNPLVGSSFDRLHTRVQAGKESPEGIRVEATAAVGLGASFVVLLWRWRRKRP
jgi:hypothetical protein